MYEIIDRNHQSFKLYTISFGGDVSSEVLQNLLRGDNIPNYRHMNGPEDFSRFMEELGCTENIIIARNITIKFNGCKPLLSNAEQNMANPNNYTVKMSFLDTDSFITFPFEVNQFLTGIPEINLTYQNVEGVMIEIPCIQSDSFDINTIQHQWRFKTTVSKIIDLSNNRNLSLEQKQSEATRILGLLTSDLYGIFVEEILSIYNAFATSLVAQTHSRNHNAENALRQLSSQAYAHSANRSYSNRLQSVSEHNP